MSTPKTRIQKGKALENYIVEQLIAKGLSDSAQRTPGSGSGRDKRDINTGGLMILGRTAGIEAKNHKVAHMKDWWEQTVKLEDQFGYEPVLAYKLYRESYAETKVVIRLDTFLELLVNQNDATIETGIPQDDKWKIKRAVDTLKDVQKIFEKYS